MQRLEAEAEWSAHCVFAQGIKALFGRGQPIIVGTEIVFSQQTGISTLCSEQLHTQQHFRHAKTGRIMCIGSTTSAFRGFYSHN